MKLLALDFGGRRIGVAVGDSEIGVANARPFLLNDGDALDNLVELIEREGIEKILIGLPRGFREETQQTDIVRKFAEQLDAKIAIPLEFVDERFTSKIATSNLQTANLNSREQKNLVDSESARIILQEFFDA